jgi:ABC-type oligopeptide transport system ATPase subunit
MSLPVIFFSLLFLISENNTKLILNISKRIFNMKLHKIISQKLTYFSFSKNQELYTSLLSAASQADSSQLKIFDQDKNLVSEIDAFDLFFFLDSKCY